MPKSEAAHATTSIRIRLKRRRKALLHSLLICGLAALHATLCYYLQPITSVPETFSTRFFLLAPPLLLSAVLMPPRVFFGYSAAFLIAQHLLLALSSPTAAEFSLNTESIRIVIFGAVVAAIRSRSLSLPPFLAVAALWGSMLAAASIAAHRSGLNLDPKLPHFALKAGLETICVLLFSLLQYTGPIVELTTRLFPDNKRPKGIPVSTALMELTALLVWAAFGLLAYTFLDATRESASYILGSAINFPYHAIAVVAALLVVPIMFSVAISSCLITLSRKIQLNTVPSRRLLDQDRDTSVIREISEVLKQTRSAAEKFDSETRNLQLQIKSLNGQILSAETAMLAESARQRELERFCEVHPWGNALLNQAGELLYCNTELAKLLSLGTCDNKAVVNRTLDELATDDASPWLQEIATLVSLKLRELTYSSTTPSPVEVDNLVTESTISDSARDYIEDYYLSSTENQNYLEIYLRSVPTPPPSEQPQMIEMGIGIPRHTTPQAAIALYIRKLPDLRDYQLQLLAPRHLEVASVIALDTCKQIGEDLNNIIKHIASSTAKQTASLDPLSESGIDGDQALESMLLLRNIERTLQKCNQSIQGLLGETSNISRDIAKLNVTNFLQASLKHLEQLLGRSKPFIISPINDRSTGSLKSRRVETHSPEHASGPIELEQVWIKASQVELNSLGMFLIALVKLLVARVPEIHFGLATETIGPGTASIIPGSNPGRFVRIALSHQGQSVTTNMIGLKAAQLKQLADEQTQLEVALTFLATQAKRMNGFLTLQSSSTKGTALSIYLPVERTAQVDYQERPRRTLHTATRKSSKEKPTNPSGPQILVVSEDPVTNADLKGVLGQLGYRVSFELPANLTNTLGNELSFGGSGFEEPSPDTTQSDSTKTHFNSSPDSSTRSYSELNSYDLLIFNLRETTEESISLLQRLQHDQPGTPTIILTSTESQADEEILQNSLSGFTRVTTPLNHTALSSKLTELIGPGSSSR